MLRRAACATRLISRRHAAVADIRHRHTAAATTRCYIRYTTRCRFICRMLPRAPLMPDVVTLLLLIYASKADGVAQR